MKSRGYRVVMGFLCLLAVASCKVPPASARVFLKPSGQRTAPLRMKSVEAEVSIVDHVADTRNVFVFANESPNRVEADFIMTLPPGAIVTYFAYWFGEEKVVARILDKKRAATIYKHITTRQRDPALVEMVNRNTFRARIFPVEANADLKVEMRFAQALPTDRQGAFYTYPLLDGDGGATLDRIALRIRVARDPLLRAVENNLGLPVRESVEGYTIALEGENYRPTKDLRVNLAPVAAPVGAGFLASLYAARSGGPDGFFVLTIVPFRALDNPRARITGISPYDVLPARLGAVNAHGALHIFGRYRGHGPAVVEVQDGAWSGRANLMFPDTTSPGNPAAPLWAAEKIFALSENDRNRATVTALSKRYNIPSRFTSWLAVPTSEMRNYWRDTLWSKAATVATQLATELDAGRGQGSKARNLRALLNGYARRMEMDPATFLADAYHARVTSLASSLAAEEIAGRPNSAKAREMRRRLDALSRRAGINTRAALEAQRRDYASRKAYEYARKLAPHVVAGRENGPEAMRLRAAMKAMARRAGQKPSQALADSLYATGSEIGRRLAKAEHENRVTPDEGALRARLARIERASAVPLGTFLRNAHTPYDRQKANHAANALADEILAGRGEGETARSLRAEFDGLVARSTVPRDTLKWTVDSHLREAVEVYITSLEEGRADPQGLATLRAQWERGAAHGDLKPDALDETLQRIADARLWMVAGNLVEQRHATASDLNAVARMEQRLGRLSVEAGKPPEAYVAAVEEERSKQPTLRLRDQIIAERRKNQPDHRRLAELEREFLKTEPFGPRYAKDRIERLAVEVELDTLSRVESPTAVQRVRRVDLERRREELRSRMGDPLIQVEAPSDALRVVALMPDGAVKPLAWNAASARWEARFDIPTWAAEGTYAVTVVIVEKNGTRRTLTVRYHVDITPPAGAARAVRVAAGPTLRLELDADPDTARVSALLPWGAEVALGPSAAPGRFFALADIPLEWRARPLAITYILTDKAHNRATLTVAVSDAEADGGP